jgi:hypothetical protein
VITSALFTPDRNFSKEFNILINYIRIRHKATSEGLEIQIEQNVILGARKIGAKQDR